MRGLEDIEFRRSRLFSCIEDGEFSEEGQIAVYFAEKNGRRVLTDEVGRAVWEALPGSGARVCKTVQAWMPVSRRLVQEFLYVLACSGIIETARALPKEYGSIVDDPDGKTAALEGKTGGMERREEISGRVFESAPPADVLAEDGSQDKTSDPGADLDSFSETDSDKGKPEPGTDVEDLVSVILVTFNGKEYIEPCLRSVFNQTYPDLEVICVDNHSTDGTVDIIRRDFPQVRLEALPKNRHYAGGINAGLKLAGGRWFFILNQDTELEPDCIARLVEKARSEPRAGAVVPMLKFSQQRGFINGLGNQINNHGWGTDNFIYCVDIGQFRELKEVPSACFGAVLLSREAVADVGPVDIGYGSFYEDSDWSLRCWYRGWRLVPAPRAVVYHAFGGSYPGGRKLSLVVRNRLRIVLKLFQGRVMLGFLKNYIREDIRNCLSYAKKRHLGTIGRYGLAYMSLALQLPGLFWKRASVMRRKVAGMREREVLIKNPSFYCCLNPVLRMPEIDTAVMRRYYRWHLMKGDQIAGKEG